MLIYLVVYLLYLSSILNEKCIVKESKKEIILGI